MAENNKLNNESGGNVMKMQSLSLITILALGVVLTACGNKSGGANAQTTIEFMHSSVEQERLAVITELVNKFQAQYPNVIVKQVPVEEDSFNTKVVTLASSGKLPAVLEVGQDYAKVMNKDKLIDLDAVKNVIGKVGESKYYEGALRLIKTEDGQSYTGVPISGWVQGIFYNKTMLKSKNLAEPTDWNGIMEVAKAFTDKANKKYGIALPTVDGGFSEQAFSQFALSNNANVFNEQGEVSLNTPEMKEALTYYKELSKYTMPGSNDVTEVKDAFMNGSAPMAIYSTYLLPGVFEAGKANDIGFVVPSKQQKAVFGTVSALTISSGLEANQKNAAEDFVTFMSQAENTTKWVLMSPGGAQPVNKEITENPEYKANKVINAFGPLSSEIAASFKDIQVFGLVKGKNFLKMGDVRSSGAIPKMVNSVTVGGKDVDSSLKETATAIENVLKK